jgi:hypothetical protein
LELIEHDGLFLIVENIDNDESREPYTDGNQAHEVFAEIKAEIERADE